MSVRPQHRPRFDHTRAKAMRVRGFSYGRIAAELGVSPAAVRRVCDPHVAARMDAASRRWSQSGICPECGGPKTRMETVKLCRRCASLAVATTVRADTLRCVTCREWKPDSEFPRDSKRVARRHRKNQCRVCGNGARRMWAAKNPGRDAAARRAWRRRKLRTQEGTA